MRPLVGHGTRPHGHDRHFIKTSRSGLVRSAGWKQPEFTTKCSSVVLAALISCSFPERRTMWTLRLMSRAGTCTISAPRWSHRRCSSGCLSRAAERNGRAARSAPGASPLWKHMTYMYLPSASSTEWPGAMTVPRTTHDLYATALRPPQAKMLALSPAELAPHAPPSTPSSTFAQPRPPPTEAVPCGETWWCAPPVDRVHVLVQAHNLFPVRAVRD